MTSNHKETELLNKNGWHQVGGGHWMHPGILAGQQRFTTEEAIAHEAKAAVAESKEPVSLVAEKEDWQEEMRNELGKLRGEAERLDGLLKQYQEDFTDVARILIPEVVAEGKGFTTGSLLDAARKAVEMLPLAIQLRSHAQLDEESVKRIKEFVDETKKCGGWQKPVSVSASDASLRDILDKIRSAGPGSAFGYKDLPQWAAALKEERDRFMRIVDRACTTLWVMADNLPEEVGKLQGRIDHLGTCLGRIRHTLDLGCSYSDIPDAVERMVEARLVIRMADSSISSESAERIKTFLNEAKENSEWKKPVFVSVVDEECAGCKKLHGEMDAALAGWKGANEETDQHKAKLREEYRARNEAVAKRIVNVLCHGTTCLISGRAEQVEQIVSSALGFEAPKPQASEGLDRSWSVGVTCGYSDKELHHGDTCDYKKRKKFVCRDCIDERCYRMGKDVTPDICGVCCFRPKPEQTEGEPEGIAPWIKERGEHGKRIEVIEQRLKAQEDTITQMKNDLYPIEHPNRKVVDGSEGSP